MDSCSNGSNSNASTNTEKEEKKADAAWLDKSAGNDDWEKDGNYKPPSNDEDEDKDDDEVNEVNELKKETEEYEKSIARRKRHERIRGNNQPVSGKIGSQSSVSHATSSSSSSTSSSSGSSVNGEKGDIVQQLRRRYAKRRQKKEALVVTSTLPALALVIECGQKRAGSLASTRETSVDLQSTSSFLHMRHRDNHEKELIDDDDVDDDDSPSSSTKDSAFPTSADMPNNKPKRAPVKRTGTNRGHRYPHRHPKKDKMERGKDDDDDDEIVDLVDSDSGSRSIKQVRVPPPKNHDLVETVHDLQQQLLECADTTERLKGEIKQLEHALAKCQAEKDAETKRANDANIALRNSIRTKGEQAARIRDLLSLVRRANRGIAIHSSS